MASYAGGRAVNLGVGDVLARLDSGHDRRRNRGPTTINSEASNGSVEIKRNLGQKLDRLIALCVENKASIEAVRKDGEATKQDLL